MEYTDIGHRRSCGEVTLYLIKGDTFVTGKTLCPHHDIHDEVITEGYFCDWEACGRVIPREKRGSILLTGQVELTTTQEARILERVKMEFPGIKFYVFFDDRSGRNPQLLEKYYESLGVLV